jgi:peptidoglycan/LPS O-acetylase OafA/YrhL
MRAVRINLAPTAPLAHRIAAIDELKGLGIILILIYHIGGVLGIPNYIHGEIGVDIFLILSGFTLAANSADIPLRQFMLRRFLRIYPSYWIALGLFAYLDRYYLGGPKSWEDLWEHVVGIHGFSRVAYFADYADAFWFISMIVAAYIVFACIRRHLDNLSLVFAVCGFLTVLASLLYAANGHVGGMISLAVRIPSFFVGIVSGRLLSAGTAEVRFDALLGLGLLSFYYLSFFRSVNCLYTLPATGIVLTWIGLRPFAAKIPGGRGLLLPFSLAGVFSYEIFLFH